MMETWKDIVGFEGLYRISNEGNILSLLTGKVLSPYNNKGYLMVRLYKNNKSSSLYVHRLVAQSFVANPNGYIEINHIDENNRNNHHSNLEWCSRVYNCNHGSRNNKIGMASSMNKLTPVMQLSKEGTIINTFNSINEAGEYLGKNPSHISSCCTGKRRTAFGFVWKYLNN